MQEEQVHRQNNILMPQPYFEDSLGHSDKINPFRNKYPATVSRLAFFPTVYFKHGHLPISFRHSVAFYVANFSWIGVDFSYQSPPLRDTNLLGPFLLMYSRHLDMYLKLSANFKNIDSYTVEIAKEGNDYEYNFRTRFFGLFPSLRFFVQSKVFGGLYAKSKGTSSDVGYMIRRNFKKTSVDFRVTTDLEAYKQLIPKVKLRISRKMSPLFTFFGGIKYKRELFSFEVGTSVSTSENTSVSSSFHILSEGVVNALGVNYKSLCVRIPIRIWDGTNFGNSDLLVFAANLLSLGISYFIGKRNREKERQKKIAELRKSIKSKADLEKIMLPKINDSNFPITILIAFIGTKENLDKIIISNEPFSVVVPEELLEDVIDLSVCFRFYNSNSGLRLPSKKTPLIGYLEPVCQDHEALEIMICYRRADAKSENGFLEKRFDPTLPLSIE